MARPERLQLADQELSQPALVLGQRFVQRWDLYARQLDDGRYICVQDLLNVGHLYAHLRGEMTLGTYVLDQDSQAKFLVLDADDEPSWQCLGQLARSLAGEGVPSYLEQSRRGGHLWLFLAQAAPGLEVRNFGRGLLDAHQVEGVELFPKQDALTSGPGSLMRMPFGVHQLTGRRYGFYDADGALLAGTIREQIALLAAPQFVPKAAFEAYRSLVSSRPAEAVVEPLRVPAGQLSERIKASVTVLEFVSQYVDLKPSGSGVLGLCPFHDDHNPSFGVNDKRNFWNCFAGCGGGSVIDFYILYQKRVEGRECDFTTAVTELAQELL